MYSTCTFSYDENESVVQYMIDKYNMQLCHIDGLDMLSDGIGDGMQDCRRIFPHKNKGEGHFMALLRRTEESNPAKVHQKKKEKRKDTPLDLAINLYREFEKSALNTKLDGEFVLFGDNLYLMPEYINLDKLRVLRCGLHLGIIKRNRFEPSHSLSHALPADMYINRIEFSLNSDEIKRYMHGETLSNNTNGWCIITADSYSIGWGKGSNGIVKNHYPKALRTL